MRFTADDDALRPMGRATSGVTGMKFRSGDELLSANVVTDDSHVFVVTEGGYAKRTEVQEYRVQGRGGLGIKVAKLAEVRGGLVGGLIVGENDEVLVVMESGKVVRSNVSEVPSRGRDTMGVIFAKPGANDTIVGVARNAEREIEKEVAEEGVEEAGHEDVAAATAVDPFARTESTVEKDAIRGGEGEAVSEEVDVVIVEDAGDPADDADAVALEDNDNGGDA